MLGPNGAGKTSLLLLLIGVLEAQAGSIEIGGLRLESDSLREIRRRLGLVFQDPDDQLFMPTVEEDVAFGPANLGLRGPELRAQGEGGSGGGRRNRIWPTVLPITCRAENGGECRSRLCWR